MSDARFPSAGVDNRFPSAGVDNRFPSAGVDNRFPEPGVDNRFNGVGYGGFTLNLTSDGEISIDNATGDITVTVTGGIYAGTYTTDIAGNTLTEALVTANRFVCFARPQISGTTGLGDTLTGTNGLWLYDAAFAAPSFTYQWQSNAANISAATASTFVITASEQGTDVTIEVTAAEGATSVMAESLATAVPAGGGFSENAVTVTAGDYLTAPATIANNEGVLLFASYIQAADGSRRQLISWDGVAGCLWSDYSSTDGFAIPRFRVETVSGSSVGTNATTGNIAVGDRIHVLVSLWMDGTTLRGRSVVWDATSGAWSAPVNANNGTVDVLLRLSDTNIRLFADSDNGANQRFEGTAYRLAMWTFADDTLVPDVSAAAVQNNFTSAGVLVDPATSRTAYGTPVFDFSGNAAAYNAGTHDGSLGSFTATGTFT